MAALRFVYESFRVQYFFGVWACARYDRRKSSRIRHGTSQRLVFRCLLRANRKVAARRSARKGGVCGDRANETRPIPLPQSQRVNTTSLHRSLLERVSRVLAKCTNECRCARFAQALPVQHQIDF